jgi:hypothetical protein
MKFIIIHKEPFVDRMPNVKAFICFAISQQHEVYLVTTKSTKFAEPTFLFDKIKYYAVPERRNKYQLPTTVRFYFVCIFVLICNIFSSFELILAGRGALILGAVLGALHLKKFSSFIIEYPNFSMTGNLEVIGLLDKLEYAGIRSSKLLITHDKLHAVFIAEQLNLQEFSYATIPGGTPGLATKKESTVLHEILGISTIKKILLHSGGFGQWFDSNELASLSSSLPKDFDLVFHVSYDISNDEYYLNYLNNRVFSDRSLFSMHPVASDKLDELVSSARIGVAWYSRRILGYRATNMGLAAGKIGNYLKCGIPVIVPNFRSLEYISEYLCGVQIENLSDISRAVAEIENNYELFSANAIKCYNEIWQTDKYCAEVVARLI